MSDTVDGLSKAAISIAADLVKGSVCGIALELQKRDARIAELTALVRRRMTGVIVDAHYADRIFTGCAFCQRSRGGHMPNCTAVKLLEETQR